MTQKLRVLSMLKAAGPEGVRSDTFLSAHIPRAAARILELKAEGHEVTSEREKQFVRYRIAGVGAGQGSMSVNAKLRHGGSRVDYKASVDSSEPTPLFEEPQTPGRPSMFDDWAA